MDRFILKAPYRPAGDPAPENGSAEGASVYTGGFCHNGLFHLGVGACSAKNKEPFSVTGQNVVYRTSRISYE